MRPGAVAGVGLRVPRERTQSRLSTLFRALLVLPPAVVTAVWFVALLPVVAVVWLARVAVARHPSWGRRFAAAWLRYALRTSCYLACLVDEFPRTGGARRVDVSLPETTGRPLLRLVGLVPAVPLALLELTLACACVPAAWFAILITGRVPSGVADVLEQTQRFSARFWAYAVLVSDTFPWFEPDPSAGG